MAYNAWFQCINGCHGEFDLRDAPPTVLHNLDTPTICARNGGAAGYGLDLALGCDIRIATASACQLPLSSRILHAHGRSHRRRVGCVVELSLSRFMGHDASEVRRPPRGLVDSSRACSPARLRSWIFPA